MTAQPELKPAIRPKAALPPRFKVEEDGQTTRIEWRWFNPLVHLFLAFFCVAWDGFLVVWYGIAFFAAKDSSPASVIMMVFPIAHVAVGVGLTYFTLAGFVNRTRVSVSRNQLTIRHGPLPWKGNLELPGKQFTQLYGEEIISRGKNGPTITYNLLALDREGQKVKLLSGLTDKDQVLYLEQTMERRLGIEDAAVAGEVAVRSSTA
jgi:hypothetical protein